MINFCWLPSPFVCNLLGIFTPYVMWSSNDKLQNSCFNNKVFSRGKCWKQFMVQHFSAPTLHIDSSNNIFSILETEPLKSTTLRFFLWKEYFFFFTPTTPTSSTSNMWVSLNAMRCFIKGYPSRIFWASGHFQMVIIVWHNHWTNTRCKAQHGPPQADHQELLPMSRMQPPNLLQWKPHHRL